MASVNSSANGHREVESQGQSLEFTRSHNSVSKSVKGKESLIHSEDQETMELFSRARAQEKEILYLREQIAIASIKESQMLNEKYALERKFSELRMALDEKQNEVITSASNELARRKGDLEVNLNLLSELKAVEDERHIFTSSILGVLAEYGAWPHVTNASALSNNIKHLHDKLQLKIRSSHAKLAEMNSMIGTTARNSFLDKEIPSSSTISGQLPSSPMGIRGSSQYAQYVEGRHLETANDMRYVQDNYYNQVKTSSQSGEMRPLSNNEGLLRTLPDNDRNATGQIGDSRLDRSGYLLGSEQRMTGQFSQPPVTLDGVNSFGSEEVLPPDEGPGIENFQIIGDAKPGFKLLGCGYPVRGTSLCMFQWVRHYPDGTRQYIEGATNPDYVVTADDVDKIIAVECIPMDEQGRQGDLVRIFANDHSKITCDDEMQEEIDSYISKGQATFSVLILLESSENWEPATIFLRRSGFQVRVERNQDVVISEKYSNDMLIKIPNGLSPQFVVTCSNGSSYPFSTSNDIRTRDTLVLTMRIFQNKKLHMSNVEPV